MNEGLSQKDLDYIRHISEQECFKDYELLAFLITAGYLKLQVGVK